MSREKENFRDELEQHLIMNHADDETVEEIWMELTGCSRICWSKLDDGEEYFDLAWYMITGEKPSRKDDPDPDEAENAKKPRKRGQREAVLILT